MQNSNEADLKREKRSLKGKIKRRETWMLFARRDIREYEMRLRFIEERLAEYTPKADR